MQPERNDQDELAPVSDRLVGVRGPNAAQRARALHLATVSNEISAPAADTTPAEPLAELEVARRTPPAHPPAGGATCRMGSGSPAARRRRSCPQRSGGGRSCQARKQAQAVAAWCGCRARAGRRRLGWREIPHRRALAG